MLIEIKHRYTNNVLYSCEAENMREAVLSAIKSSADLSSADLSSADLSSADLSSADLSSADLSFADLSFADLRFANLRSADLRGEILAISPLFINGLYWNVIITESLLTIGCKRFEHTKWKEFTDEEVAEMDENASEFWSVNKSWLLSACKSHRKESLKFRKENM
jgi:uncharacterized protein YjbI with pentapeptide repeats